MADNMALIVNPGNFKATREDPEQMLSDFNLYIESFTHFHTIKDST